MYICLISIRDMLSLVKNLVINKHYGLKKDAWSWLFLNISSKLLFGGELCITMKENIKSLSKVFSMFLNKMILYAKESTIAVIWKI